ATARRCELRLKPSWSASTLQGRNYIGRLWMARRDLVLEAGGFHPGDKGRLEQSAGLAYLEWNLLLRITNLAEPEIARIPRCLYHRALSHLSEGPVAPPFASEDMPVPVSNIVSWPLVSVIIPT